MADKFEDLRTFKTVASCGGINAAAAEIGIAKSAVSRRISDLEGRLGVRLIDRTTKRFELTAVGSEYLRRATELLADLERLDADPAGRSEADDIAIAADAAVMIHLVSPALARLRTSHPKATFSQAAEGAEADVGISAEAPAGRVVAGVIAFELVLCASPGYLAAHPGPTSASELDHHAGILFGAERGWTLAGGARRTPGALARVGGADVAVALAVAGLGIAQLPEYAVSGHLKDGALVPLLAGERPPPEALAVHCRADAGPAARALADFLVESHRRRG